MNIQYLIVQLLGCWFRYRPGSSSIPGWFFPIFVSLGVCVYDVCVCVCVWPPHHHHRLTELSEEVGTVLMERLLDITRAEMIRTRKRLVKALDAGNYDLFFYGFELFWGYLGFL